MRHFRKKTIRIHQPWLALHTAKQKAQNGASESRDRELLVNHYVSFLTSKDQPIFRNLLFRLTNTEEKDNLIFVRSLILFS